MPQGKLFHISWSIFTTQTSAHHFLISERCNDSVLFLKGSPCLYLVFSSELRSFHGWWMDVRGFCVTQMKTAYTVLHLSQDKLRASTSGEQLPGIPAYWEKKKKGKRKKKKVSRHIYNVSLVGREGEGYWSTSPEPGWCQRSTLGEVNLESFILLSCLLVLRSEDQTLMLVESRLQGEHCHKY